MRSAFFEKHWWIGLLWILSSIVIAPGMIDWQSRSSWLVSELPAYSVFFLGALWTTYFSRDHPVALGLSHLVTVTALVIGMNYSYNHPSKPPDFSGWNGLVMNLLIGSGAATVTVVPGVLAGLFARTAR